MVGILTLAAEIGEDVDVRAFEEMSLVKKNPGGNCRFYASMKPKFNLLIGGTGKVGRWERNIFFVRIDENTVPPLRVSFRAGWNPCLVRHRFAKAPPAGFSELVENLRERGVQNWPYLLEEKIQRSLARIRTGCYDLALAPLKRQAVSLGKPELREKKKRKKKEMVKKPIELPDYSMELRKRDEAAANKEVGNVSATPTGVRRASTGKEVMEERSGWPKEVETQKKKKKRVERSTGAGSSSAAESRKKKKAKTNDPSSKVPISARTVVVGATANKDGAERSAAMGMGSGVTVATLPAAKDAADVTAEDGARDIAEDGADHFAEDAFGFGDEVVERSGGSKVAYDVDFHYKS